MSLYASFPFKAFSKGVKQIATFLIVLSDSLLPGLVESLMLSCYVISHRMQVHLLSQSHQFPEVIPL